MSVTEGKSRRWGSVAGAEELHRSLSPRVSHSLGSRHLRQVSIKVRPFRMDDPAVGTEDRDGSIPHAPLPPSPHQTHPLPPKRAPPPFTTRSSASPWASPTRTPSWPS
jgi:hypothetical protein